MTTPYHTVVLALLRQAMDADSDLLTPEGAQALGQWLVGEVTAAPAVGERRAAFCAPLSSARHTERRLAEALPPSPAPAVPGTVGFRGAHPG